MGHNSPPLIVATHLTVEQQGMGGSPTLSTAGSTGTAMGERVSTSCALMTSCLTLRTPGAPTLTRSPAERDPSVGTAMKIAHSSPPLLLIVDILLTAAPSLGVTMLTPSTAGSTGTASRIMALPRLTSSAMEISYMMMSM